MPRLVWLEANAEQPLSLSDVAHRAGLSTRTLSRRFRDETAMTPVQWLRRARVRRAQLLLETTDHPVDTISRQTGFRSATNFRDTFKGVVGTTPQTYRQRFRGSRP